MMETATILFTVLVLMSERTGSLPHMGDDMNNGTTIKTKKEQVEPSFFLRLIFQKYGREEVMTFEGLEHLLDNLGLGIVTYFDHALQSHIDETGNFIEFHGDHVHNNHRDEAHNNNLSKDHLDSSEIGRKSATSDVLEDRLNESEANISCLSAKEIFKTFHIQYGGGIQASEFLTLCPALVYQLDRRLCRFKSSEWHDRDDGYVTGTLHLSPWIGAFSAVGTISIAGFFIVGIIPCIANCAIYSSLIQFLISLAVGTLTADALLHLLPHAMIPHHSDHSHDIKEMEGHEKHPIWVGLVTFGSILVFFLMERFLKISSNAKVKKNSDELSRRRLQSGVAEKEANKHPANPLEMVYLNAEKGTDFLKDGCICSIEKLKEMTIHHSQCTSRQDEDLLHRQAYQHEDKVVINNNRNIGQPNEDQHHIHKGHGHSHKVPSSIASVAWMVIMGDGLHNFTDGLAIGASFSKSIPIGLSTSIAVLCHELPHEMGDFAVLLRSGMSMKQALLCNLMSSILCFLGASLGIAIGNINSITSWVFSITAGIFIYIALVDMLPQVTSAYELDSQKKDEIKVLKKGGRSVGCLQLDFKKMGSFSRLLLHTTGITFGLALMLIIAIFEDKITFMIN